MFCVGTLDQVVHVCAMAGVVMLVLGPDTLLSQCLATQAKVYKWVLANLMLEVTLRWTGISFREEFSRITP